MEKRTDSTTAVRRMEQNTETVMWQRYTLTTIKYFEMLGFKGFGLRVKYGREAVGVWIGLGFSRPSIQGSEIKGSLI